MVPPSDFPSKTNVHPRHWVPKNLKPRTQFFTHRFQQHDKKCCGWTLVLDEKSDGGTISVFSYITASQVPNLIKNETERAKNKSRKLHEANMYLTLFLIHL